MKNKNEIKETIMFFCILLVIMCNFIQICVISSRMDILEKKEASLDCYSEDFYFVNEEMRSDNCSIKYR